MAEIKDRHSRMAYSTVRAPPKKNGKGGKFTWGADDDCTDYYLPVGPGGGHVAVATSPVGSPQRAPIASPHGGFGGSADISAFPPLGTATPPTTVSWGPSRSVSEPESAPPTPEPVKPVKPRAPELFDSTHPRNAFAPLPRRSAAAAGVVAIDWSSPGVPSATRIPPTNAAHLSKFATPPPPPAPAAVFRSRQPLYRAPPPQHVVAKRVVVIQQPQRR